MSPERFKEYQENLKLQLRAEAFNVTNTPHFTNPNGDVGSDGFMTITGAKGDERQVRLGLRLEF